ncbi:MAG: alpha-ketoacid dehydrogenase subunit beta [Armatimonadetes bacterium]|nr:alpha-ketoacid dehydrogenase subunit beta [Armatimonadota bacterium]
MLREITQSDALREALAEEMRRDPAVFVMGEDVGRMGGIFNVTKGLADEFGAERVRDTPISENGFVAAALGASVIGGRPVVELMFGDFTACAMDALANQIAKARYMSGGKVKAPLVVRTTIGARGSTAAQHSQSPHAWFVHTPGLYVVAPSTPADCKGLLKSAIRTDNPVIFWEHKKLYFTKGAVPDIDYTIPLGVADIKREGRDVTVVAISIMVNYALSAAEKLAKDGIEVEVVDPRTLVPMDWETIYRSVRKTGRLVIMDEGCLTGGVAAEIAAKVGTECFDYLDAPIERVCATDTPVPFSPPLEEFVIPNEADLEKAVRSVLTGAQTAGSMA